MKGQASNQRIELTAHGAWIWIALQILWVFVSIKGLSFFCRIIPGLAKFLLAHFAHYNAAVDVLTDGWLLLAAYWCSKSKSVSGFGAGIGLNTKPTLMNLFFVLPVICLAFVSLIGTMNGLTGGNWIAEVFAKRGAEAWSFYVIYACSVSAFAEEVAIRGFVYKAFRGNYGILLSTALIVGWEIFAHWQIASHSVFNFCNYCLFAILVCIIREKTRSIWNCIFCHAIGNAVMTREWFICIVAMLIWLSILDWNPRARQASPRSKELGPHTDTSNG